MKRRDKLKDENNEEERSVKKRKTKSMMIIRVDFEQQPFQIHNYIHTHDMNIMKT